MNRPQYIRFDYEYAHEQEHELEEYYCMYKQQN
jgi:hypothetical protein